MFGGADTAKADTVAVKPNLARILPSAIFHHTTATDTPRIPIAQVPVWDPHDTMAIASGGFVQSLGQVGKMYRQWNFGFGEEALLPANDAWRNPLTGRFDRRYFGEKDIRFFDTKTPYVNIDYAQGGKKLLLADITASRNINRQWNISARHTTMRANGVYSLNETRTRNMSLGVYYRLPSNRYHAFLHGAYTQLDNQLNGGELWIPDSSSLTSPTQFRKNLAILPLNGGATAYSLARSVVLDQYFHLIGNREDSAERIVRSRLTLRLRAASESWYARSNTGTLNNNLLNTHIVPIVPTRDSVAKRLSMAAMTGEQSVLGGASYQLHAGIFILKAAADISYRRISLSQDSTMLYVQPNGDTTRVLRQQLSEQHLFGELTIPKAKTQISADIYQSVSSLFKPQQRVTLAMTAAPQKNIAIRATAMLNNVNPSLFQTYFIPRLGNTFTPNKAVGNQQFTHLRGYIRWKMQTTAVAATPSRKADSLHGNFAEIGGFLSRADNYLFYDRQMRLRQASGSENLTWIGIQGTARVRGWQKFYAEASLTAQRGSTNAPDTNALRDYARNLPALYGRASLYYQSRTTRIASILRTGVDVWFNTNYQAQTPDVVSGEWFPTGYVVRGYPRVDAYFSARLMRTYFFIKVQHLNEGIGVRGYHTTPIYPMLGRSVILGVNWNFYD